MVRDRVGFETCGSVHSGIWREECWFWPRKNRGRSCRCATRHAIAQGALFETVATISGSKNSWIEARKRIFVRCNASVRKLLRSIVRMRWRETPNLRPVLDLVLGFMVEASSQRELFGEASL